MFESSRFYYMWFYSNTTGWIQVSWHLNSWKSSLEAVSKCLTLLLGKYMYNEMIILLQIKVYHKIADNTGIRSCVNFVLLIFSKVFTFSYWHGASSTIFIQRIWIDCPSKQCKTLIRDCILQHLIRVYTVAHLCSSFRGINR